ncbi:MAG: MBL fold metallo-hydrolase [Desulfobacteraceae bacterium]|nr:MAG: MBL fold metallo-hydrolase [Desulfobacteraceae bacterium]
MRKTDMKFGSYECDAIEFGNFFLDGGAMFGVVPKILWEKKIPADDKNFIPMKARSLLIRGNGKNILVDTGPGRKLSEKMKKQYGIDDLSTDANEALSKYGLSCNDITDVIITHLHFDHVGGSTIIENENAVPAFPNAKYYLQETQFETAINPGPGETSSYAKEDFMPLEESGVLKMLHGASQFLDGIEIIVTNGHAKGQQHPLIMGESASLFFCADLIPTSAHISLSWRAAYDNYPLTIMSEKEEILSRAIKENWILFFEHDPFIAAATIRQGRKSIEADKIFVL